jgi:hypothetical protein
MNRLSAINSGDKDGFTRRKYRRLSKRELAHNSSLVSSPADYILRGNISPFDELDLSALKQTISTSANHPAYCGKPKE